MRNFYFIRHAYPDIPIDERWCVGKRMDIDLNALGKMQACLLGEYLKDKNFSGVYCSGLKRAKETASALSDDYVIFGGLEEKDMGEWDGLSFNEIQEKYTDIYELREKDINVLPPEAETLENARNRFDCGIKLLKALSNGDIAIVSHGGILRDYFGNDKLPYTGFFVTDEDFNIISENTVPTVPMTPELARKLRDAAGMLPHIKIHCDAVAKKALKISSKLREHGINLDDNVIECSALLHDIARLNMHHEKLGGRYLEILGYHDIAEVIRQHAELDSEDINEAAVVSAADKILKEDKIVSTQERFEMVREKVRAVGLEDMLDLRLAQSLRVRDHINEIVGENLIP